MMCRCYIFKLVHSIFKIILILFIVLSGDSKRVLCTLYTYIISAIIHRL